ncbi:MAG TPA: choice-of-anchor D domain-containing protein [Myxococcales bacterium]|jgi:hypothetical protein
MRTLLCALAAVALAACGGPTTSDLPEDPLIQPDRIELNFGADFGNAVYVDSSLSDTIQLQNGGKQQLTISKVELSGPDAAFFSVTGQPKTAVESTKSTFVQVTYAPTEPGSHKATLTITSNSKTNGTLTITMAPSALWKYKTAGLVTDSAATPKALAGMKVTCVKPKGASCTGESDCLTLGLSCIELTCQNSKWKGWDATTGADGKFSAEHSWDCGEILVQDPAAAPTYASNVGPFTPKSEITVKLSDVYKVKGKVVEKATTTGLAGIKVSCEAPKSAPLSWKGWSPTTTGGDGTFSNTHVWPCLDLYAEDSTNTYKPATGVWSTATVGVTIEMEKN